MTLNVYIRAIALTHYKLLILDPCIRIIIVHIRVRRDRELSSLPLLKHTPTPVLL